MHLPYIQKIFADSGKAVKLLPLMVGQIKANDLPTYAQALMPLFMDPKTLFIISTDFCHWGRNFDYMPVLEGYTSKPIYQSIEALDKQGMALIEA